MKLSTDYLREAIEKLNEKSDAKAAERLKISRAGLSQYLSGTRIMDDFTCIMVADVLGVQGMEIIAAAQMERETSEDRKRVWEDFRRKLGVMGVAGLMAVMLMGLPQQAKAENGAGKPATLDNSYILCQISDCDWCAVTTHVRVRATRLVVIACGRSCTQRRNGLVCEIEHA